MKNILDKVLAAILPFLFAGITIVLFVVGIIIFSYILLFGALVGLILFIIAFIFMKIKMHQLRKQFKQSSVSSRKGRTIDHDDNDNDNGFSA